MRTIIFCLVLLFSFSVNAQTPHPKLNIIPAHGATPWTNLHMNDDTTQFQFAIVTDRTGGHREGVFMDAVNKLNLLQPEFVMSVGDLIEGYITDIDELNHQWEEFDSFVEQLQMPFFYLPGNHDITNQVMEDLWLKRYGPTYYHFIYKDILFLCLNSEDSKKGAGHGTISDDQFQYIKTTLAENSDVDWTLVFMHQPLWTQDDTTHWRDVEQLLAGRKHTVFTGHNHRYVKYDRNDGKYFILGTTGGVSRLRGPGMGEFDHVMWVTMTKQGPIIANLLLEGIWDENIFTEATKIFIDTIMNRNAIQITPFYTENGDFDKGELTIKITNDENIPAKLRFEEKISTDLMGTLDTNTLEIPPNSVAIVKMELQKRKETIEKAMTLHTSLSYAPEDGKSNIEIPFRFNIKPLPRLILKKVSRKKKIDGDPKDWNEFPYSWTADDGGDMEATFNVCYDKKFLYLAVNVMDDTIASFGTGATWTQDNVGFGFNALPLTASAMSTGSNWYEKEFYQLITPQTDTTASLLYRPLIEGAKIVCKATATGYFMEAKVPLNYVIEKQGKNWKTIRLELVVDDKDGDNLNRYWWQPNWMSLEKNIIGSGMFFRE